MMLRQVVLTVAMVCLICSAVIHLLTYFGHNAADTIPAVWLLHLGTIPMLLPLILWRLKTKQDLVATIHERMPPGLTFAVILGSSLLFAIILGSMVGNRGVAVVRDGQSLLVNHGKTLKVLSEAEFHTARVREQRAASGIWMIFYSVPILFYTYVVCESDLAPT